MNKHITDVFNQFAGREIPVVESQHTSTFAGKPYTFDEVTLANPNDPTLQEMQKVANDNGLQLRVWLPDSMGTDDWLPNRVNAHVEKAADGKYRVSNKFDLG